jgi:hypothetical protein
MCSGDQDMKAAERVYWSKFAGAIGVAFLTLALQVFINVNGSLAFVLGILLYMVMSDLLSSMNGVERSRGLKIGVGIYFFTWLMVWILLYTIVHPTA